MASAWWERTAEINPRCYFTAWHKFNKTARGTDSDNWSKEVMDNFKTAHICKAGDSQPLRRFLIGLPACSRMLCGVLVISCRMDMQASLFASPQPHVGPKEEEFVSQRSSSLFLAVLTQTKFILRVEKCRYDNQQAWCSFVHSRMEAQRILKELVGD